MKRPAAVVAVVLFVLTVVQLAVATFVPSLPQFEGKAFGARLISYPLLMLVVPLVWWLKNRSRDSVPPWDAFALIMAPFLVDVTGNTLDLYDSVVWWDDLNHFANWLLLMAGFGLLLARVPRTSRWMLVLAIAGLGAILAVGWELSEWYTFIRHGTELDDAYTDTLGDEALGTLGGLVGALYVAWRRPAPLT